MVFRYLAYTTLLLVALTACGSEPEQPVLDRRFLTEKQMSTQAEKIRNAVSGEILAQQAWTDGAERVFTLLTREQDPNSRETGIFLRHYQLGHPQAVLRWTYRDTIACLGAAAGAVSVIDQSLELRPRPLLLDDNRYFALRYSLSCVAGTEISTNMVLVNADSGTPALRLEGNHDGLTNAYDLVGLPEDTVSRLLALWSAEERE